MTRHGLQQSIGSVMSRWLLVVGITLGVVTMAVAQSTQVPAYRTHGSWHSSVISGGGYIINVVPSATNPDRLYTYSDVGGAFRSEDNGETWTIISGTLPGGYGHYNTRGLIVDPRDDSRVTILVGNRGSYAPGVGVFVSEDAGGSWKHTLKADTDGNSVGRAYGFVLVRSPHDPDQLVVATNGNGVFTSRDNGLTWRNVGLTGLQPVHVQMDRSEPKRWWVSAREFKDWQKQAKRLALQGGFFMTEDGGQTWTKLAENADTPIEMVQDPLDAGRLIGIVNRNRQLAESRDHGRTWQPITDGLMVDLESATLPVCSKFLYIALGAGPDFILTANTLNDVFMSNAGESKWRQVKPAMNVQNGIPWWGQGLGKFGLATSSVTVNPHNPSNWYITDFLSIFQTRDAGKTWQRTNEGVEVTVALDLAQDPSRPMHVHAAVADIGYMRSTDGGMTFPVHAAEGYTRNADLDRNAKTITVSRSNPDRVYVTVSRGGKWQTEVLYRSDDGGHFWRISPMRGLPNKPDSACNTVAVHPEQPDVVVMGISGKVSPGDGGVYRSTDGGQSWQWMGQGLPANETFFGSNLFSAAPDLAISGNGDMVCFTPRSREVFYYEQQQSRWLPSNLKWVLPANARMVTADEHRPGRFYMGIMDQGMYRSDDGGRTWNKLNTPAVGNITVDRVKPGRIAAAHENGVIFSEDDGRTWLEVGQQMPHRTYRTPMAFAGDRLLVGTNGNGIFWRQLPGAEEPNRVAAE